MSKPTLVGSTYRMLVAWLLAATGAACYPNPGDLTAGGQGGSALGAGGAMLGAGGAMLGAGGMPDLGGGDACHTQDEQLHDGQGTAHVLSIDGISYNSN